MSNLQKELKEQGERIEALKNMAAAISWICLTLEEDYDSEYRRLMTIVRNSRTIFEIAVDNLCEKNYQLISNERQKIRKGVKNEETTTGTAE